MLLGSRVRPEGGRGVSGPRVRAAVPRHAGAACTWGTACHRRHCGCAAGTRRLHHVAAPSWLVPQLPPFCSDRTSTSDSPRPVSASSSAFLRSARPGMPSTTVMRRHPSRTARFSVISVVPLCSKALVSSSAWTLAHGPAHAVSVTSAGSRPSHLPLHGPACLVHTKCAWPYAHWCGGWRWTRAAGTQRAVSVGDRLRFEGEPVPLSIKGCSSPVRGVVGHALRLRWRVSTTGRSPSPTSSPTTG